jgi:hypothetical protein
METLNEPKSHKEGARPETSHQRSTTSQAVQVGEKNNESRKKEKVSFDRPKGVASRRLDAVRMKGMVKKTRPFKGVRPPPDSPRPPHPPKPPSKNPFEQGVQAAQLKMSIESNPYLLYSPDYYMWLEGFAAGSRR